MVERQLYNPTRFMVMQHNNLMKTMRLEAAGRTSILMLVALLGFSECSRQPKPETLRIQITAHRYAFEPAVIRVRKGKDVILEISTTDVQHGFSIKELGIDESIQKGRPAVVNFSPRQIGEYKVECSVLCGPRHDQMRAKLVVE